MNAEWLRYYFAAKLNSKVEDVDFAADDFVTRINSDLVGKYVNIASRAANFINRHFAGELAYASDARTLQNERADAAQTAQDCFEARDYSRAVRHIMAHADKVNQAFDAAQPWVKAKGIGTAPAEQKAELQAICSRALAGFKALSVMLAPVLPALSLRVATELFGDTQGYTWRDAAQLPTRINPFKHLIDRKSTRLNSSH